MYTLNTAAVFVHAAAVGAPPRRLRHRRHRMVAEARARRHGGREEIRVVGGGRGVARDRGGRATPRALRHPARQPPQPPPQADAGAVHAPHAPRPQGLGT